MPKKTTTRTMTCKLCGMVGFNSRNCPTKTAPWTVLTQVELDNITKKLGIAVSEVSQAQIDFALSQRPVDFDGDTLAHFYHNNKDRFELALKLADTKPDVEEEEPQDKPNSKPTSQQEKVALSVMSDDGDEEVSEEDLSEEEVSEEPEPTNYEIIEDVRWNFDKELFLLSREPGSDDELEIGNSIFIPTFREDGTVHLQVMVSKIGYKGQDTTHTCFYEFDDVCEIDPEMIASDFYADFLGVVAEIDNETPASVFASDDEEVSDEELSVDEEETEDQVLFDGEEEVSVDEEEVSFDDTDFVFDYIPEGALFVGFQGNPTGFDVILYDADLGYLQGTKTIGFSFSTELGFNDAENVIKAMQGAVELLPVDVSDLKMLKFMRPDAIPFEMWEEVELDTTSEQFATQWLVPVNSDVDPIVMGGRIDPIGRKWLVQAVCIEQ